VFGTARRPPLGLLDLRGPRRPRSPSRHVPFSEWDQITQRRQHPLVKFGSTVFHAGLLLLLLLSPAAHKKENHAVAQSQPRNVQMMYIPPEPPAPRPRPKPPEPTPPQPRAQPKPPPQPPPPSPAFATSKPTPSPDIPIPGSRKAPDHDEPVATAPKPSDQPKPGEQANHAKEDRAPKLADATESEDAMVTEARRLFGPPPAQSGSMPGPVQTGLPLGLIEGGRRCPFSGVEATPIDRPAEGVIEGVVRTESGGAPIPGALLQILGTGSATIADGAGHYRLVFDPSLVDACRSQVVRISAPGYRARTMILAWGNPSDNVIDLHGK
jgi:hypothetical protein